MSTIGIIYNLYKTYKRDAQSIANSVAEWLSERGESVHIFPRHYETIADFEEDTQGLTLKYALVFGGDGTVLYAARLLSPYGIPLLCINTGSLGFISEITLDELYPTLERVLAGDYVIHDRSMLQIQILDEEKQVRRCFNALNDAVIMRNPLSYIIDLETYIDDEYVTTHRADGLIIASSTGSTAYSLSAGGPILMPEVSAYIVNPICPHALFNRALVIPDHKKTDVRIQLREKRQDVLITIDGQSNEPLQHGDVIEISLSAHQTRLIKLKKNDFFHIMRSKLFLGR